MDTSYSSRSTLELFCVPWKEVKKIGTISSIHQAALKNSGFWGVGLTWF